MRKKNKDSDKYSKKKKFIAPELISHGKIKEIITSTGTTGTPA